MMVITGEIKRKKRKKLNPMKMIATKKKEANKNGFYSKKMPNNHPQWNNLKVEARKRKRSKKQNRKKSQR